MLATMIAINAGTPKPTLTPMMTLLLTLPLLPLMIEDPSPPVLASVFVPTELLEDMVGV